MDIKKTKYYNKMLDEQKEWHFRYLNEFCESIDKYIDRRLNGGKNDRA